MILYSHALLCLWCRVIDGLRHVSARHSMALVHCTNRRNPILIGLIKCVL